MRKIKIVFSLRDEDIRFSEQEKLIKVFHRYLNNELTVIETNIIVSSIHSFTGIKDHHSYIMQSNPSIIPFKNLHSMQ